jgi:hypothetical protein
VSAPAAVDLDRRRSIGEIRQTALTLVPPLSASGARLRRPRIVLHTLFVSFAALATALLYFDLRARDAQAPGAIDSRE